MADSGKTTLPTKGSLDRIPFAKLLRALAKERATGSLFLLREDTKKVVFFEDGAPVFVRSNVLSECLGQVLAQEGLITQEQCDQTLEAIRRTGKKQGELLVEMGILSGGNLRYGLQSQLRLKLVDIFTWGDGRFQFKEGPLKLEPGLRLQTDPAAIIVSSLLETADADQAAAALDPVRDRFPVAKDLSAVSDELEDDENYFFRSLDGARTVDEVVAQAEMEGNADSVVLYALIAAGAVQVSRIPRSVNTNPPPPPERHNDRPDDDFVPEYEAKSQLREFEDTPLPGVLPERPDVTDDVDSDFAAVENVENSVVVDQEAILDQEPDAVEATFDDEIEVLDDGELEMLDDDELEVLDEGDEYDPENTPTEFDESALDDIDADLLMDDGDLVSLDELDAVPLGDDESAEVRGAMRYSEGEAALQNGDYATASVALDEAYELGVDMAELHAMLAYARYCESGGTDEMASHAMELLQYAESMNPHLDIVFAYRAAVFLGQGDNESARASAQHALSLNDYCDVALQVMDQLG
jgi:hypothetical protein